MLLVQDDVFTILKGYSLLDNNTSYRFVYFGHTTSECRVSP